MEAKILDIESIEQAVEAIESVGASNSEFMATRAIQMNCLVKDVPVEKARAIKKFYNEVGAEAAISHDAFYGEDCQSTDMMIMGTLAHHREVRRVVEHREDLRDVIQTVKKLVEHAVNFAYEGSAK